MLSQLQCLRPCAKHIKKKQKKKNYFEQTPLHCNNREQPAILSERDIIHQPFTHTLTYIVVIGSYALRDS